MKNFHATKFMNMEERVAADSTLLLRMYISERLERASFKLGTVCKIKGINHFITGPVIIKKSNVTRI